MPFITQERRIRMDHRLLGEMEPGDRCYVYYREMMKQWKEAPRWTTADRIYRGVKVFSAMVEDAGEVAAKELAWQVFFNLHVMPYEIKKRDENGEVL